MENNGLGFDFSVLDVYLVPTQNNGNILAHPDQVPMPVWYILIRYPCCDIEHDDGALALDIVAISQATKFLLSSGVPDVESDRTSVCVKDQGVDLHSQGS